MCYSVKPGQNGRISGTIKTSSPVKVPAPQQIVAEPPPQYVPTQMMSSAKGGRDASMMSQKSARANTRPSRPDNKRRHKPDWRATDIFRSA